jgi:hypothetical protein
LAAELPRPAVSEAPISFTDTEGRFFVIPLSALSFASAGALKPDKWPLYLQYKAQPFLQRRLAASVIQKGPVPATKSALMARNVTAGTSGVVIAMTFANVAPNAASPPSSTANVIVKETNLHGNVTLTIAKARRARRAVGEGVRSCPRAP